MNKFISLKNRDICRPIVITIFAFLFLISALAIQNIDESYSVGSLNQCISSENQNDDSGIDKKSANPSATHGFTPNSLESSDSISWIIRESKPFHKAASSYSSYLNRAPPNHF